VKNLIALVAIFAVIAAIVFGVGFAAGRSPGVVTLIFVVLAGLASLWLGFFLWFGAELNPSAAAAMDRLILKITAILPMAGLVAGFILGRQSA
jgi:hypothetical protein